MSDPHSGMPKTTPWKFILALVGGLAIPLLVIFLIVKYILAIQATHLPGPEQPAPTEPAAAVTEQAQPAPQAAAEAPAPAPAPAPAAEIKVAAADADKGKKVYGSTCSLCHAAGVAGAPKAGDKAAWSPRIAQGKDTLYKHAINGFTGKTGAMPPKGGNATLSDDDVKAAVDYMVGLAK